MDIDVLVGNEIQRMCIGSDCLLSPGLFLLLQLGGIIIGWVLGIVLALWFAGRKGWM